MLSYGISSRLRRAKSSSSTQTTRCTVVESQDIDFAIARQHAVTAASLALERASERAMPTRDNQDRDPWQTLTPTSSAENEQLLGRRQSVRFTGPMAVSCKDRPITRRVAEDPIANHDPSADPLCASPGLDDQATRGSQDFMRALPAVEGNYPGTRVSSLPSSYRKLRKAKSMFNPRSHRPVMFTNGASKKMPQLNRPFLRSPAPRLHKSFSFLRGDSDNISSDGAHFAIQDTAIQIARDRYLHQVEHQNLKGKSSFPALEERRRPQKAFRKTVRTSSTNSDASAVASVVPQPSGTTVSAFPLFEEPISKKAIGRKARIFSLSLKNKLKRVFHRPSDADGALPKQQINATRSHFGQMGYMATSSGVDQQYDHIPSPDRETLRKARSREYIFHDAAVFVEKASHPGSIRSVRSDEDVSNNKSRVTSWTSSTAANTMTSNQAMEKKRLSIIQEHGGPHQTSSSVRYYGDLGNVLRQPVSENTDTRTGNVVNSQRIYSALQRRMHENKVLACSQEDDSETENEADMTKIQSSSAERIALSSRIVPNTSTDSLSSRRQGMLFSKPVNSRPSTTAAIGSGLALTNESTRDQIHLQKLFDMQIGLTPQQIADSIESENPLPKRPLREVKSTFFPSTMRIERSNTSPYRRAMNTSSEDGNEADREITEIGRAKIDGSPFRRITPNSTHGRKTTGSESVYSRTSSGNTPKPSKSSLSLAVSVGSGEPGSAVIITTRASKYGLSQNPFEQRRSSSVKSSGTWQKWMASQIAHLENHGDENKRVNDVNSAKENGHKREEAQIDGDDVHVGRIKSFNQSPKQPLGIIQGNVVTRPALRHRVSLSMADRYPIWDVDQSAQPSFEEHGPITPRACSATPPGREQFTDPEKISGLKYNGSRERRPKPSSGSLGSPASSSVPRQGQLMDWEDLKMQNLDERQAPRPHDLTPVKHLGRKQRLYSPERIARLRRKQSSNSMTSEGVIRPEREVADHHRLQENQMIHHATSPGIPKGEHEKTDGLAVGLPDSVHAGSPAGHKMVDMFLNNRRKHMRISEESGTDPAFL